MNTKSPYTDLTEERAKSLQVKEWAIKKLKQGSSANKISQDIKRLFGVDVAMMTVYRWRNRYAEVTGEHIPRWADINKTSEQKEKNKSTFRWKKNVANTDSNNKQDN